MKSKVREGGLGYGGLIRFLFFWLFFLFVFKQVRVKAKMNSGKEENRQLLELQK